MKKIKYLTIFIITLVLATPCMVLANNTSGGGSAPAAGNCSASSAGCSWNYPGDTQSFAVRLSLYKYNGNGNPAYYGSVNYCANGENAECLTLTAYQTRDMAGKVAYQTSETKDAKVWTTYGIPTKNTTVVFPKLLVNKGRDGNWDAIEQKVIEMFSFNSPSNEIVLNRVKEQFGGNSHLLTTSDIGNLYITIEPAFLFQANGLYYFGTAYEIAEWLNAGGNGGAGSVTDFVYKYIPRSIVAKRTNYTDRLSFIGKFVELTGDSISINRDVWNNCPNTSREDNTSDIRSKAGYGINVFWLGNYVPSTPSCTITESADKTTYTLNVQNNNGTLYYDINSDADLLKDNVRNTKYNAQLNDRKIIGEVYNSSGSKKPIATCSMDRPIPTCKDTCSGKGGDDLLGCAENYCQAMYKGSKTKKACIITCGYNDPGFKTCGNTSSTNGKNTVCDEDTEAKKSTCKAANSSNYYQTVCTDTSTIKYGNSLPVTILPGTGFSYTPIVSGSKTCEMTFEVNKWKFDYAAAYTQNEKNTLLGILRQYNDITQNSIWARDDKGNYKYKSDDANIEIEITNNNNPGAKNNKTTKKLIVDKTVNLLDEEVKISSGGSYNVPLFNGGNRTNETVYGRIMTKSSNKTSYKLPGVCMKNGTLYDLSPSGKCDSNNDGPYYEYYTDLKIKKDSYPTYTKVTKNSSNLNVSNTCDYNVNSPVSCSIAVVDCNNNQPNKAELRIENKYGLEISYGLSSSDYKLNNVKTYNISKDMKRLYGAVGINGDIVATCSLDLSVPTCMDPPGPPSGPPSGPSSTCEEKYKPSQYSEIKDYCRTSWMFDKANYSSENECYESCSNGANTCKNNPEVDTSSIESVTNFCKSATNRRNNGYDKLPYSNGGKNDDYNIAMCINDCIDRPKTDISGPGTCLGIACDYLYRPISLIDPFPQNRDPGYNWYKKEIFITDDLLNPLLNPNGADPEYVIELTPDIIELINKDTDEYNKNKNKNAYLDYVYNNDNNKNGNYVSKFIHSNDGFRRYFKVIESKRQ